jgi:integrase
VKTSEGGVIALAPPIVLVPEPPEDFTPRGVSLSQLLHAHAVVKFPTFRRSTIRNHLRTRKLLRLCNVPEHPSKMRLQLWSEQLRSLGLSDGDVDLHLRNLSAVFTLGNLHGLVAGNPVALLEKRRVVWAPVGLERIRERWPEFLAVAGDELTRAFLGVLRFAGLRKGEALGLRWSDLTVPDPGAGRPTWAQVALRGGSTVQGRAPIVVPRGNRSARRSQKSAARPATQGLLFSGAYLRVVRQREVGQRDPAPLKTEASKRRIPLRQPLVDLLLPVAAEGDALMFPFGRKRLGAMARALQAVDPKAFKTHPFHAFRHTLAMELVEAGKPVDQIRRYLGHASTAATERYLANLAGAPVGAGVVGGLDHE